MRITLALVALGHLALLAGCGRTPEDEPQTGAPTTGEPSAVKEPVEKLWITLGEGCSVALEGDMEKGENRIVVTVPEGQPGAGTYSSSSPHVVDLAGELMTVDRPNVRIRLEVDTSGRIHTVEHTVTMPK